MQSDPPPTPGITLEVDTGGGDPLFGATVLGATVLGDRVRFRQIRLNLLTNAVKFIGRGGTVRIRVDLSDPNGIGIRITDTGIGMSPEDLERVLRPFERVDVRTTRPTDGVGLGLALSRALVREHDGSLHITSAPRQGTTVHLTFPRLLGRDGVGQRRQMSLGDALRDDGTATRPTAPPRSRVELP